MARIKFRSRVKESTNTTGTGTISLLGATESKYQIAAAAGSGQVVPYMLLNGNNWEEGFGTITDADPDTLTRTLVLDGSSGPGVKINLAGTTTVLLWPSGRLTQLLDTNLVDLQNWFVAGGSANAITGTLDPAPLGYSTGMRIACIFTATNTTTTPGLDLNTLGNVVIKGPSGAPLLVGDIVSGRVGELVHDGTNWRLLNPAASAAVSSIELVSTDPGAAAGPYTTGFRDSASPANQDVGREDRGEFRTSTAARIITSVIRHILDEANNASYRGKIAFCTVSDGVAGLFQRMSVGRGVFIGDPASFDMGHGTLNLENGLYKGGLPVVLERKGTGISTPYVINSHGTIAHGLGGKPTRLRTVLTCINAEAGYAPGEDFDISASVADSASPRLVSVGAGATDVFWSTDDELIIVANKGSTTVTTQLNLGNWTLNITPYREL